MNPSRLIFIVGPTASGKTEIALDEAERQGAAILSCDSLCVFRGMDIGTAKPTAAEQARIPHYGIDLADPCEPYSVAKYIEYRDAVLSGHRHSNRPLIVAGGSGFYLKSFFFPVLDQVHVPASVREQVEQVRDSTGLAGMIRALVEHHEGTQDFPGLDMKNPRRVEKALMRCLASGLRYRELVDAFTAQPEPLADWQKEVWLVERPREELQRRNQLRVERMLGMGLIEEVRRLRALGFERNPSACGAIGYREVLDWLDRPGPQEELAARIVTHTSQLMRKQRTWFRRQIPVSRVIRPG